MMRSLFGRLLLSHLAVILVTTIVLGLVMSWLIRNHVIETKTGDLLTRGNAAVALLTPLLAKGQLPDETTVQLLNDLTNATVWLMDQDGTILAGQPPDRWARKNFDQTQELEALFTGTSQTWVRMSRKYADRSIVVALPIQVISKPVALFLYAPVTGINRTSQALEKLLLYSLALGLLVALFSSFLISRTLTRPIAKISQAAKNFTQGNFSSRTSVTGDDELGRLGQTFNDMATGLALIDQNRRDFLATVSHELKTPVTSIQALSEALLDGLVSDPDHQRRYLSSIQDQSGRIGRLIHDLLDLAQLETGELSVTSVPIDLAKFLASERLKYEPLLSEKDLMLSFLIPANAPLVLADSDRLSQVVANLLSNAIRHSPVHETIQLEIQVFRYYVALSISDNGPGIDAKHLPHIWDRFYRADTSRSRNAGGTGLGLAVTKRLVAAMGGDITVKSAPGKTTFIFTLPIAK